MRNCLFVGSFNPVTKAHLQIPLDLLENNIVDYIYYLPVNSKKNNLVSIENRINMLNLVKKTNMEIINIYNYQENGLFNYLTLTKLTSKKITHILMGSDLFLKFHTFLNYQTILNNYYLIVVKRNFDNVEDIILDKYQDFKDKIIVINKEYNSSSTKARKLKNDLYLDKKVLDYIKINNLYN